jgi:acyl carrier protein
MYHKDLIKKFFEENFMVQIDGKYSDNDSLLENGIIDSTGVLEIVTFLEEKFGIQVEDEEIIPEYFDSINNLDNYLNKKLKL